MTDERTIAAQGICNSSHAGVLFPWETLNERQREAWAVMADGGLAALRLAGYAVLKLPEPSTDDMGAATWPVAQHWQGKRMDDGEVRIRKSDGRIAATSVSNPNACPEDARSLGAALIAAADAAEAQS